MEAHKNVRMNRRDSNYLRFRPYHAFAGQRAQADHWSVARLVTLIVGGLTLLIFSGKLLLLAIT